MGDIRRIMNSELMNLLEQMVETVQRLRTGEQQGGVDPDEIGREIKDLSLRFERWMIPLYEQMGLNPFNSSSNPDDVARNIAIGVANIGKDFERLEEVRRYISEKRAGYDQK